VRRAHTEDVRVAIEFPNEQRMLAISVMQSGEITMTWTPSQGTGRIDEMHYIGRIERIGVTERHHLVLNPTPTMIPVTPFDRKVRDAPTP
jgi:hypothetical protein